MMKNLKTNFHDKKRKYYTHKNSKTRIKWWINFEKIHKVIKFT